MQPAFDRVARQARAASDLDDWQALAVVHPADFGVDGHGVHLMNSCWLKKQQKDRDTLVTISRQIGLCLVNFQSAGTL